MYSDISELLQKVSIHNNPGETYFNSFVSRFKMYRKTKIIQQRFLAACGILAVIIVAYSGHYFITKGRDVKPAYTTQ